MFIRLYSKSYLIKHIFLIYLCAPVLKSLWITVDKTLLCMTSKKKKYADVFTLAVDLKVITVLAMLKGI